MCLPLCLRVHYVLTVYVNGNPAIKANNRDNVHLTAKVLSLLVVILIFLLHL